MKENPQRITKNKPFTNKYNWEGISFPSEQDDWKKIEKSNITNAVLYNLSFCMLKKIYRAYVSKYNSNCEKHVILIIISNGEKQWYYLAVKKLSALWRGIISRHHGDF